MATNTPKLWTATVSVVPDPEHLWSAETKIAVSFRDHPELDEVRIVSKTYASALNHLNRVAGLFSLDLEKRETRDGLDRVVDVQWYLVDSDGAFVARVELDENVVLA